MNLSLWVEVNMVRLLPGNSGPLVDAANEALIWG